MSVAEAARGVLIVYGSYLSILWMLVNYGGSGSNPYTGSGTRWMLITIPQFAFIGLCGLLFLLRPKIDTRSLVLLLLGYLILASASASLKLDIKHLSEVVRWVIPVIFIAHFRLYFSLKALNVLFFAAIIVAVLIFEPGISPYGYLPGQTIVNLAQGLW